MPMVIYFAIVPELFGGNEQAIHQIPKIFTYHDSEPDMRRCPK